MTNFAFDYKTLYAMESKEYFEKVMQDFNQNRNGRSLRKYCLDEGIDYKWVLEFKKNYPAKQVKEHDAKSSGFIPLMVNQEKTVDGKWSVETLVLKAPTGDTLEIKSSNMFVVAELMHKMC